jgi:Glycosyl hydrolases family 28
MITRRKLIKGATATAGAIWLTSEAAAQPYTSLNALPSDFETWDVRRFGAKGDGQALDTAAVQAAIDACWKAGGGSLLFPSGLTFLIGTIYLKDHVRLQLEPNSTILGSDNLADYGNDVGLNPFYPETIDPCLIYAKDATDIGIGGEGRIVGHTKNAFVPPPGGDARAAKERPMLIRFDTCSQVSVKDVSLYRCGSWCMHLKRCRDIFLRNIRIRNEKQDGFDLDSCQNVSISDCHLDCGDDAIAITTSVKDHPARNITITNCLLKSRCAGIRFGPLSKGDFENISVSNCIFYDCNLGGIKLGVFEGATIRNCVFDNLVMDQVTAPISIFIATWPDIGSTDPNPPMMPPGKIHDLQFRGIRAVTRPGPPSNHPDSNSSLFFQGHPLSSIENILLRDVNITFSGGGTLEQANRREIVDMDKIDYRKDGYWTDHKTTWGVPPAYGLYSRHLKGLELQNVTFQLANPDRRSAIFCLDSDDIQISGFKAACDPTDTAVVTAVNCTGVQLEAMDASPKAAVLLRLEGAASDRIVLGPNRPGKFGKDVEYASGATEKAILQRRRNQP